MTMMAKSEKQIAALKRDIEELFTRHGLTTFAWLDGEDLTEEQVAKGGEKTYFKMGFDGDIYYVFWPLPDIGEKHIRWNNARRREFDRIVAKHKFWTEFEEYYRICFMSVEPKAREKGKPRVA